MKKLVLLLSLFLSVSSFAIVGGGGVSYFDDISFKQVGQDSYVATEHNPPDFFHMVRLYNSAEYDPTKPVYRYQIENNEFQVDEFAVNGDIVTLTDKKYAMTITVKIKKIVRDVKSGEILEMLVDQSMAQSPPVAVFKNNGIDLGTTVLLKTIDANFRLTVTNLKKVNDGFQLVCKKEKSIPLSCRISSYVSFTMELTKK